MEVAGPGRSHARRCRALAFSVLIIPDVIWDPGSFGGISAFPHCGREQGEETILRVFVPIHGSINGYLGEPRTNQGLSILQFVFSNACFLLDNLNKSFLKYVL